MSVLDATTSDALLPPSPRREGHPAGDAACPRPVGQRMVDVAAATCGRNGQHGGWLPCGPNAIFLLVFNDAAAPVPSYPPGWTLLGFHGSTRCWSQPLTVSGHGSPADLARAEAAAGELLDAHGVRVLAWRHGAPARTLITRADTGTTAIGSGAGSRIPTGRGAHRGGGERC